MQRKFAQSFREAQSLMDYLQLQAPEKINKGTQIVDAKAADALFELWRDSSLQVGKRVFKKPSTLAGDVVNCMLKEGLVRSLGDKLEVTGKGTEVIKVMVLGDDRSVYEDNGHTVSFRVAHKVTKTPTRRSQQERKAETDWWSRFEEKEV